MNAIYLDSQNEATADRRKAALRRASCSCTSATPSSASRWFGARAARMWRGTRSAGLEPVSAPVPYGTRRSYAAILGEAESPAFIPPPRVEAPHPRDDARSSAPTHPEDLLSTLPRMRPPRTSERLPDDRHRLRPSTRNRGTAWVPRRPQVPAQTGGCRSTDVVGPTKRHGRSIPRYWSEGRQERVARLQPTTSGTRPAGATAAKATSKKDNAARQPKARSRRWSSNPQIPGPSPRPAACSVFLGRPDARDGCRTRRAGRAFPASTSGPSTSTTLGERGGGRAETSTRKCNRHDAARLPARETDLSATCPTEVVAQVMTTTRPSAGDLVFSS